MATPTKKDFVSTNITTNVMSVPKKPSPAYVDTVRGSKQPLESSGLVPKYIKEKVGGRKGGRGGVGSDGAMSRAAMWSVLCVVCV